MLAKNRATAFLFGILFIGLLAPLELLTSSLLVEKPVPPFPPFAWQNALLVALLLLAAYLMSLWFINDLDASAFGWPGLLRWAASGALSGTLLGLYDWAVLNRLGQDHFLYTPLQVAGFWVTIDLVCWMIFRYNPFRVKTAALSGTEAMERGARGIGWFFLAGGGFVAGAGWLGLLLVTRAVLWKGATLTLRDVFMGSATILLGLGAALMGATVLSTGKHKFAARLFWPALALALTGILLFAAMAVLE